MLKSALFSGHQLLQDIVDDTGGVRISQFENATDPAVQKVQLALLIRDPNCLPVHGADGIFGAESAAAVHQFKVEELEVPEGAVIDDVGPLTVQRLDEIAFESEIGSITLFNQFGEVLPDVAFTVNDDGVLSSGVTDALGRSAVALTAAGTLTLDPVSLAAALGNLLDRPVLACDPSDPGDAVFTPQTRVTVNIAPREQLNLVAVARIDFYVDLKTGLEGEVRVAGTGVKVFQEGRRIRVALQVNDGSASGVFLDPPLLAIGPLIPLPAMTGWQLPNGYIVRPGDTEDSLSQRFLGVPGLFAQLSNHAPIVGEVLVLPDGAVPGWVGLGLEPAPAVPASKTWFTVAPNDVISVLYTSDGPLDPYHQLLNAIASPPAGDPDPLVVAAIRADVLTAFLALPPELVVAEPASDAAFE